MMKMKIFLLVIALFHGPVTFANQRVLKQTSSLTTLMKMALVNTLPGLNTDELQNMKLMQFSEMNLIDTDDCGKKLLCELARKESKPH